MSLNSEKCVLSTRLTLILIGHHNLFERGILHRDIHMNNVLLGTTEMVGNRGILIDLGQAVWIGRKDSLSGKDLRTVSLDPISNSTCRLMVNTGLTRIPIH